jgi:hypothetical protein
MKPPDETHHPKEKGWGSTQGKVQGPFAPGGCSKLEGFLISGALILAADPDKLITATPGEFTGVRAIQTHLIPACARNSWDLTESNVLVHA